MNKGRTVFAQVMDCFPKYKFDKCVARYALDSTTIDRCLSLFPWATFRRHKAAIKLHTLLTLQGNFPTVIIVTPGSVHDVNILDQLVVEGVLWHQSQRLSLIHI